MGFFSNLFHKKEEPAAPAAKPAAPAGDKIVCAPLEGEIRILSEIDDPVFSSEALGKGCAIEPSKGEVVAPFDGHHRAGSRDQPRPLASWGTTAWKF